MYPIDNIYSLESYQKWKTWVTGRRKETLSLKDYRRSSKQISEQDFWDVNNWDELREAVSFLCLMNKRHVLYFRGQRRHYDECLPALFRCKWYIGATNQKIVLTPENRPHYYKCMQAELRRFVNEVVQEIGTPRTYIIKSLPAATASILQHYELWPTPFIDLTRSLPISVSFATADKTAKEAYLYVFALPDLRGSITTDLDQHLTLSRLEAVCLPTAKRPHHQDAYLVARAPEPQDIYDADLWEDWKSKSDIMRRLVAKFRLKIESGNLTGTPYVPQDYLIPPNETDIFGDKLLERILPKVQKYVDKYAA